MVLMHSSAMATGCIVLDSDDDDGPCSATARSQTSGAVAFVDLCSDADENDAHHEPREDQMMTSTEAPPRTSGATWCPLRNAVRSKKVQTCAGLVQEASSECQLVPKSRSCSRRVWFAKNAGETAHVDENGAPHGQRPVSIDRDLACFLDNETTLKIFSSEHSGGSSMSVGEVRLGSLWDSEEEELPPLSARLQLRQEPPQQSTRPQKRSSVHKISDSEDEDEFPDVGHVIGVVCSATSSLMSLDMPPPPACDADIPGSAAFTLLKKPKRARLSPEEREARRVAKEQEKQRKACVTEMGRATKPGHCMKYMTVVLDSRLLDDEASLQVICDTLGQGDICAQVQMLPVERAVCWKRTALSLTQDLISREQVEERDVLVVLPWDQFLHLVSSQRQDPSKRTRSSLSEYMMSVGGVYPEKNLTYVVYSLEKYFKKEKSRTNAEYRALVLGSQPVVRRDRPGVYDGAPLTRRDIQETLVPLQLDSGVTITTKEDPQELAEYLAKLTRALAERPHREAKQSRPLQHLTAGCLSKHDSLRRTWQAQLEQFAGVSRDVAEAIVGQYPAPRLLLQAYQACRDRALGETLLADIQVRRGAGALQSTRRVGPVISGRIYRFFVATDQDAYFD